MVCSAFENMNLVWLQPIRARGAAYKKSQNGLSRVKSRIRESQLKQAARGLCPCVLCLTRTLDSTWHAWSTWQANDYVLLWVKRSALILTWSWIQLGVKEKNKKITTDITAQILKTSRMLSKYLYLLEIFNSGPCIVYVKSDMGFELHRKSLSLQWVYMQIG